MKKLRILALLVALCMLLVAFTSCDIASFFDAAFVKELIKFVSVRCSRWLRSWICVADMFADQLKL